MKYAEDSVLMFLNFGEISPCWNFIFLYTSFYIISYLSLHTLVKRFGYLTITIKIIKWLLKKQKLSKVISGEQIWVLWNWLYSCDFDHIPVTSIIVMWLWFSSHLPGAYLLKILRLWLWSCALPPMCVSVHTFQKQLFLVLWLWFKSCGLHWW